MQNRDRILDAARQVYAHHGFRGATTRLIAQAAGVNEVTIFRLFGSKARLFDELRHAAFSTDGLPGLPQLPSDPEAELTAWCAETLRRLTELRSVLRKMMSELEEDPTAAEPACHQGHCANVELEHYVAALRERGMIDPDADDRTSRSMLMSALFGDAMTREMMPDTKPQPASAAPRLYVRAFLRSLGATLAPSRESGSGQAADSKSGDGDESAAAAPRPSGRTGRAARASMIVLAVAGALLATPSLLVAQSSAQGGARSGARPGAVSDAPLPLSLDEAIARAGERSEAVRVARAGAERAAGQYLQARSIMMPQLNAVGQYQRTLKSQFSALSGGGAADPSAPPEPQPVCAPEIPATATPAERDAALAEAITCQQSGGFGGIDFSRVGFGAANQWVVGLNFSQNVFLGQRASGVNRAAIAGRRAADLEVTAQRAQAVLEVASAYYDAALAERLVAIADSTLQQTEDVLGQTRLARQVGSVAEFDLLRAQVAYENARPVVIQARGGRDVAMLRLKQLIDIPLDQPLVLTTTIDAPPATVALPAGLGPSRLEMTPSIDTTVSSRSVVRQAELNVTAQEGMYASARDERLPALAITSGYQRLFFPKSVFPSLSQYSENWTIGVSAQVSLFSGGRLRGQSLVARANLDEARARLDQVRELAALDARVAANLFAQAQAAWNASEGTVDQASRAYRIDQVRFREGITTQTDLAQTRLLLQQATANRAMAARDLAVARVRLALLRDLPLQLGGSPAGGGGSSSGAQSGTQQQQQPPQQSQGQQAQGGSAAGASSFRGTP